MAGIGDEIQALVQALRESQTPADRLSTATRLLELLSVADDGGRSRPHAFEFNNVRIYHFIMFICLRRQRSVSDSHPLVNLAKGGAVGAFVASGGVDVVHMRLHGMHKVRQCHRHWFCQNYRTKSLQVHGSEDECATSIVCM